MAQTNPLFPGDPASAENSYIVPRPQKTITPPASEKNNGVDAALTVIREKLARIYAEAPDVLAKFTGTGRTERPHSKHQQFMIDLQNSGRSLADIQTAWHNYYVGLPDHEKHQVWQEFYEAHNAMRARAAGGRPMPQPLQQPTRTVTTPATAQSLQPTAQTGPAQAVVTGASDLRSSSQLRAAIRRTVSANGRLHTRHHLQSLGFGLSIGLLTLVITLFSFFNEVIIAPFIQPGRAEGATPIIIDPSARAGSKSPEIIIPKIDLDIPVDYSQTSDSEDAIQSGLNNGVVHYPSTVLPGQKGNAVFFGHSSSNILNVGKYKFAFILLHALRPGDTFYLNYNGKSYIYSVFKTIIVAPDQVGVLDNVPGHTATATLITCDPPGWAINRLVVVGDQISPDPSTNSAGQNTIGSNPTVTSLPDNGPSLWDNITRFFNL